MSYDKKTINMSYLTAVMETLDDLWEDYDISVGAIVSGFGYNDYDARGEAVTHRLRRLAYRGYVILERIERSSDCDSDDVITSHKFHLKDEPRDWRYIIDVEEKLL